MNTIGSGAHWSRSDRNGLGDCVQPWGRPARLPDQPSECTDRPGRGGLPDPMSIVLGCILKNVPIPRR